MSDKKAPQKRYQIGEFVHFESSYHAEPQSSDIKTGRVTSYFGQYVGVKPIGSDKELFFRFDELKRPSEFTFLKTEKTAKATTPRTEAPRTEALEMETLTTEDSCHE